MRVSSKRILSIGVSLVLLIGSIVVYSTFITGELQTVNEKQASANAALQSFTTQEQAVTKVEALIQKFANLKNQDTLSLAMPNGENTVDALREIQTVAAQSNIVITALDFKSSVPRGTTDQPFIKKLGTLEVALTLSGTYEGVKRFLGLLEGGVRIANVKSFKFDSSLIPGSPVGTFNIVVDMFYQS